MYGNREEEELIEEIDDLEYELKTSDYLDPGEVFELKRMLRDKRNELRKIQGTKTNASH
jgi:hypothetical protein